MEQCYACGAKLPPQSRFCSRCGAAQEDMTRPEEQTELVSLPPEQRDERRGAAMLDLAGPAPAIGDPATPAPHLPGIQGTPEVRSIPSLPGTPRPDSTSPAGAGSPYSSSTPPGPASQQPSGQAMQHAAGHVIHVAAGKTAGGVALKWVVTLLIAVVLGGGAAGAYVLTRPQPVISLRSPYTAGNMPAGSAGTRLHLTGQRFSGGSPITVLLDGKTAPGAPRASSDSQGNLSVNLPVTTAWPIGRHTLTARDAGGHSTQSGVIVEVVAQGEAHTPGPFGAPPDDASFRVSIQFQGRYDQGGGPFHGSDTEIVTGRPDPSGGRVCQSEDDGHPHTYTSHTLNTGLPVTEITVYSCSGTYKGGSLTLTETLISDTVRVTDQGAQITCHLLQPEVDEQLTGSYTEQGTFSGTLTLTNFSSSDFSCTTGPSAPFSFFLYGGTGIWTGTISTS